MSTSSSERAVNLVVAYAPLLSGELDQCWTAQDETCVGGMASVAAHLRYFRAEDDDPPSLVLPYLDKASSFVQMHPLNWSLNRLVLHDLLGWRVFLSSPSLLTQNSRDYAVSPRDLSDLQTLQMPLLLTNVDVPPDNSWYSYTEAVHLDPETGLAVLSIDSSGERLNVDDPIAVAKGLLDFVARLNANRALCNAEDDDTSLYAAYAANITNHTTLDDEQQQQHCWTPVIIFADVYENFVAFVDAVTQFDHPPAFLFDVLGTDPDYSTPQLLGNNVTWVHSFATGSENYNQHTLYINSNQDNDDGRSIRNITFRESPFIDIPDEVKDDRYASDIAYLRSLADQAVQNDPIVGTSGFMPVHRDDGDYRRCAAGECELGNLFTDALLWFTTTAISDDDDDGDNAADVAFITSGGLRGGGWPAGDVRVSNLWEALPFPNTDCTGRISGVNLFQVFNYSTSVATFEGEKTTTGGTLLQMAGMRIVYNTELSPSRLLSIEVWDREAEAFLPLERLRIYKFATDSFLCDGNDPFPDLLGTNLVIDGEQPGVIGSNLHQDIVADYLGQLDAPYDTSIQGRMTNDTERTDVLNLVETEDGCVIGTYWNSDTFSCIQCPINSNVHFLAEEVEFEGETGSSATSEGRISLVNSEQFTVSLNPKSIPSWINLSGITRVGDSSSSTLLPPTIELQASEQIVLHLEATPASLNTGTSVATVSFGVLNGGNYPGCTSQDIGFDVFMRVTPTQDLNQLGGYAALGWTFASLVSLTSIFFCTWVLMNRNLRIVKTMQPVFLVAICVGVFLMGLSIVPMSIDDGVARTDEGADVACMSIMWLFSMGFTIAQSALFAKLWRINKLFNSPHLRRKAIYERDVAWPGLVLFVVNFTLLLIYTLLDPLRFERVAVDGEEWNSYGTCTNGTEGEILFFLSLFVNLGALAIACYQAYRARNISDEYSESKSMAFALFSWVELILVALPAVFLISKDNPAAQYFLFISLIFAGESQECCRFFLLACSSHFSP